MTYSVNLVPAIRLHARRRTRRMRAWLGACAGISVLLATGWGAERTAGVTLRRLAETVGGLEGQRTEAQRRLLVANGQRARLVEQLQTVVGARRPQLWPRRSGPSTGWRATVSRGRPRRRSRRRHHHHRRRSPAGSPSQTSLAN